MTNLNPTLACSSPPITCSQFLEGFESQYVALNNANYLDANLNRHVLEKIEILKNQISEVLTSSCCSSFLKERIKKLQGDLEALKRNIYQTGKYFEKMDNYIHLLNNLSPSPFSSPKRGRDESDLDEVYNAKRQRKQETGTAITTSTQAIILPEARQETKLITIDDLPPELKVEIVSCVIKGIESKHILREIVNIAHLSSKWRSISCVVISRVMNEFPFYRLGFKAIKNVNNFLRVYGGDPLSLEFLHLHLNEADLIEILRLCPTVQSLNLEIQGDQPHPDPDLSDYSDWRVTDFKLSKRLINEIVNLKRLKKLTLGGYCQNEPEDAPFKEKRLISIVRNCSNLEYLCIISSLAVTDAVVREIVTNLKNLNTLILESCDSITNEGAKEIPRNLKNLKFLSLARYMVDYEHDNIEYFDDSLVEEITTYLKDLEGLDLCTSSITYASARRIGAELSKIKRLGIGRSRMTLDSIDIIRTHLKDLEMLDISDLFFRNGQIVSLNPDELRSLLSSTIRMIRELNNLKSVIVEKDENDTLEKLLEDEFGTSISIEKRFQTVMPRDRYVPFFGDEIERPNVWSFPRESK